MDEWTANAVAAEEAARRLRMARRIDNEYEWRWVLRMKMLSLMRSAGIARLDVPRDVLLSCVASKFPDQKNWVSSPRPWPQDFPIDG